MGNRITVTSDELSEVAGQMNAAGAQIGAELSRMLRRVSDLSGTWTGNAGSAFNGFYNQFNQNWSKCEEALRGISSLLTDTARVYDEQEQALASRYR